MALSVQTKETNKEIEEGYTFWTVYKWVLSHLKPILWKVILFIFCGLVAIGIEMAIPKFIEHFIDYTLPQKQMDQYVTIIMYLSLCILVMLVFQIGTNFLERIIREECVRDIQFKIIGHLRKLGMPYFEKTNAGEILSLFNNEVHIFQELFRRCIPDIVKYSIIVAVSVYFMLTLNIWLTLIMIPSFLLYRILGPFFERKATFYGRKVVGGRTLVSEKIYESLSSIREIKAYGAERWDLLRYERHITKLVNNTVKQIFYSFMRGSYRRFTYHVGGISVFILGVYLIKNQHLSVGGFVAFLFYYFFTMQKLTAIVTRFTEQRLLITQIEKLYKFMSLTPEVTVSTNRSTLSSKIQGDYRLEDVDFQYTSNRKILSSICVTIKKGKRNAIVGSSGSGKSTLIKLLSRFYNPTNGTIYLDGENIIHYSEEELREKIGYLFQEPYLFGGTIKENILFGCPSASEEEMIKAAEYANCHEFIMELPDKYNSIVGERGIKLSGGQKQRIAIARLFLKNPTILILDEATSALDNVSENEVKKSLDTLFEGRTIIAIAHRLSTIRDYDHIIVMNNGRVVEAGDYNSLVEQKNDFYTLVNNGAILNNGGVS